MIVETFLLTETKTPIRGKSFHQEPNFRDQVLKAVAYVNNGTREVEVESASEPSG